MADDACFLGIQFYIAQRFPIVLFVKRRRVVAVLKQVAGAPMLAVEDYRPPGVDALEQAGEAFGSGRSQQPVNVIVHEALTATSNNYLLLACP